MSFDICDSGCDPDVPNDGRVNVGACPSLFTAAGHQNVNSMKDHDDMDNALFELYKKEKVNMLKRKFNINDMNDIAQIKMKKAISIEDNDCSISKLQSYPSHFAVEFKSKVQRAFGHILSTKIQDSICQCFDEHCISLASEHSVSVQCLVLNVLKLLSPNLNVDKSILCAHCNMKSFVAHSKQCVPSQIPEVSSPKVALDLKIGCKSSSCSRKDVSCDGFVNVGNASAIIKDVGRKVSFNDINESVPQGCSFGSQKNPSKFSHSAEHKLIRGVNYAPDTFSPSPAYACYFQRANSNCDIPPLKQMCRGNNSLSGHSNSCSKHAENIIDLEDETDVVNIPDSKLMCTPNISGNVLRTANTDVSPEVVFLRERKLADRLNKLCKKSEKMYNDELFALKQSYRRASRGIDQEDDTVCGAVNDDLSIVEEHYCSRDHIGNSASIHKMFNQGSRFHMSKYEILFFVAVCNFSRNEA